MNDKTTWSSVVIIWGLILHQRVPVRERCQANWGTKPIECILECHLMADVQYVLILADVFVWSRLILYIMHVSVSLWQLKPLRVPSGAFLRRPCLIHSSPSLTQTPQQNFFLALHRSKANISTSKLSPWETGNYFIKQTWFAKSTMRTGELKSEVFWQRRGQRHSTTCAEI